jgi:hypothetical protein
MGNPKYFALSLGRALEKLVAQGSIKDRLHGAVVGTSLHLVEPEDVPKQSREEFQTLMAEVLAIKDPRDSFTASINALSDERCAELAAMMVRWHCDMLYDCTHPRPRSLSIDSTTTNQP